MADQLTSSTVPSVVGAAGNQQLSICINIVCEYSSHHKHLMMEIETVSEMSDTNSTLMWLITLEDFIVSCCCESFKSISIYVLSLSQSSLITFSASCIEHGGLSLLT